MAYLKKKEEDSASLPTLGMLKGSSLTELQLRKSNKAVLEIAESKEPKEEGYIQPVYSRTVDLRLDSCMHAYSEQQLLQFHGGCGQC